VRRNIELVKHYVTAINFNDSSSAKPRMSSIACCKITADQRIDPVLQIAARDTTRTGLQVDATGLNELGVYNVLCISGDSPIAGFLPRNNLNILDIDSVQMLWILRRMRDDGIFLDGRKMKNSPRLFLGAASSPTSTDSYLQAIRDQKKVNAGAQIFQANLVFELEKLDLWLEQLYKRNILNKGLYTHRHSPFKKL
jgi:methylenetetrahydrofolate reductase (NADPH)